MQLRVFQTQDTHLLPFTPPNTTFTLRQYTKSEEISLRMCNSSFAADLFIRRDAPQHHVTIRQISTQKWTWYNSWPTLCDNDMNTLQGTNISILDMARAFRVPDDHRGTHSGSWMITRGAHSGYQTITRGRIQGPGWSRWAHSGSRVSTRGHSASISVRWHKDKWAVHIVIQEVIHKVGVILINRGVVIFDLILCPMTAVLALRQPYYKPWNHTHKSVAMGWL